MLLDRRDPGLTFGYSTLMGQPESRYEMIAVKTAWSFACHKKLLLNSPAQPGHRALLLDAVPADPCRCARAVGRHHGATPCAHLLKEITRTDPLQADSTTSISAAAQLMSEHGVSSLLVVDGGELTGIVTDRDLRSRVLALGRDPQEAIAEIMTCTPVTVNASAQTMEALLHMAERGIHHLPVVARAVARHRYPIRRHAFVAERPALSDCGSFPQELRRSLLVPSTRPPHSRARRARLHTFRSSEPHHHRGTQSRGVCVCLPSASWAPHQSTTPSWRWVPRGREMALASDQDNALVLADDYDEALHGEYFARLSEFVCTVLDKAYQVLCRER